MTYDEDYIGPDGPGMLAGRCPCPLYLIRINAGYFFL